MTDYREVGAREPLRSVRMSEGTFRLVTANLFAHRLDPGHLASVLDALEPDVLATVELSHAAAEVIATRFPHRHLAPKDGYSGWGLAARMPLDVDPGPPAWRRGGTARITVGETPVHTALAHILDPLHLPLRRTLATRRHQVEALLRWGDGVPRGSPQLVVGDLNSTGMWPAYRRLASRWDDLVARTGRARRTWGLSGGPRLLRLDHVLGSGLVAIAADAVPVRGSDHLAVVVDLTIT